MTTPVQMVRIQGNSMSPFIRSGDLIEVEIDFYKTHTISRGEVVLLQLPTSSSHVIKRVIAVPKDHLRLSLTALYVNGELAKNLMGLEYEIRSEALRAEIELSPLVPDNSILVMGEPRKGSYDSSMLGFVPIESVKGRVSTRSLRAN